MCFHSRSHSTELLIGFQMFTSEKIPLQFLSLNLQCLHGAKEIRESLKEGSHQKMDII